MNRLGFVVRDQSMGAYDEVCRLTSSGSNVNRFDDPIFFDRRMSEIEKQYPHSVHVAEALQRCREISEFAHQSVRYILRDRNAERIVRDGFILADESRIEEQFDTVALRHPYPILIDTLIRHRAILRAVCSLYNSRQRARYIPEEASNESLKRIEATEAALQILIDLIQGHSSFLQDFDFPQFRESYTSWKKRGGK